MKKLLIATLVAAAFGVAHADEGNYVSPGIDFKDKQNSTNNHTVYGVTLGHDFGNTWRVEGRMEDETVNGGSHEGLAQVELFKDIGTWYGVTPYAGAGVGLKDKATSEFWYYRVDGGLKYTNALVPGATLFLNERLRTPFNEGTDAQTGYNYRTYETKFGVNYSINKQNAVGISYAIERGDTEYNTVGVNYKYSF